MAPASNENHLLPRALRAFNRIFVRVYHRIDVLSPPRLPARGAAILVCNHVSGLDPLLIQSLCSRIIVWMMAKEYYEIRALEWFFNAVQAIPVERSGRDLAATRAAFRALARGQVLGVFPEGKIERSRDLLPFQTGVAMMAIKTGAPVYPAYIDGTQRRKEMIEAIVEPNHASLIFGPPVEFERHSTSKQSLEAATQRIRDAVEALKIKADLTTRPVAARHMIQ